MNRTIRECRLALGLSQRAFEERLGVSAETYRVWDSGRRDPPPSLIARACTLFEHRKDDELLPLGVLARLVNVHVRTLRAAARDRRLPVHYDTRTTFHSLRARATRRDAEIFRSIYYRKRVQLAFRPRRIEWSDVPGDYDTQIRDLRRRVGLSQSRFAEAIGAARHPAPGHS
jgi:DNA-binding transcriptional regulator YiaG